MVTQRATKAPGTGQVACQTTAADTTPPAVLAATLVATLGQALLVANQLLSTLEPANRCHDPSTLPMVGRHGVGLSRRELEVLRLLATGRSNRQIAAALCLSPRTVQRHLANVYLKLGAHCRAEATAYALRHGLA